VRILGVDVGRRRVGFAISDASGTLASPLTTVTVTGLNAVVDRIAERAAALTAEEDGLDAIVIGLPKRLNGDASEETAGVLEVIAAVRARIAMPVHHEDERLTSREAESRLAVRERDWRKRKEKIDAAAAAIMLQDFLDRHRAEG